jgi:hypothetical protein
VGIRKQKYFYQNYFFLELPACRQAGFQLSASIHAKKRGIFTSIWAKILW